MVWRSPLAGGDHCFGDHFGGILGVCEKRKSPNPQTAARSPSSSGRVVQPEADASRDGLVGQTATLGRQVLEHARPTAYKQSRTDSGAAPRVARPH